MLLGLVTFILTHMDSVLSSPSSRTSWTVDSEGVGSLLQREFTEMTESDASQGSASDLLYLSSVGMDLGANLAPTPWELLEFDMKDLLPDLFLPFHMRPNNMAKQKTLDTTTPRPSQFEKSFNTMARQMHLQRKYTSAELAAFKNNFVQAVTHETEVRERKVGVGHFSTVELRNLIKQEMILQQPVTTQKVATVINKQKLGWTAGLRSQVCNLTLQVFESALGYVKTTDAPIDSTPPESEEVALLGGSTAEPPEKFDARTAWPECAKIISAVSDQGRCASCWAITAVGVFNDRLCIASGGYFKSYLSAADVVACDRKNYGCKGGNPAWAAKFLKEFGTVTGSNYGNVGLGDSCFPYPVQNIDSTKHFQNQVQSPKCHASCPEKLYPRPYKKDKYFAAGNAYLVGSKFPHRSSRKAQDTWESLKKILTNKGSIMMTYAVGRSHVAYETGFWDCPAGKPNHMVRCIGYGTDPKHGRYITCVQSWGKDWGEEGLFRMKFPGKGCLEMLLSFPVSWVGKNLKTGLPPDLGRSIWKIIGGWFNLRPKMPTIR